MNAAIEPAPLSDALIERAVQAARLNGRAPCPLTDLCNQEDRHDGTHALIGPPPGFREAITHALNAVADYIRAETLTEFVGVVHAARAEIIDIGGIRRDGMVDDDVIVSEFNKRIAGLNLTGGTPI